MIGAALALETRPHAEGHAGDPAMDAVASVSHFSLAHQAARAQALLDRIADVSTMPGDVGSDHPETMSALLARLDEREALLSDLEPVVAELSVVRGQLAGQQSAAQARALDLALAPVELAARRALGFHEQLLEKMQAMRDEMVWEIDRLDQLGAMAHGYLADAPSPETRLDVRR